MLIPIENGLFEWQVLGTNLERASERNEAPNRQAASRWADDWLLDDAVEKLASWVRRRGLIEADARSCRTSCHGRLPGDANLGELAEVLGSGGEVEFVSGTIGSA